MGGQVVPREPTISLNQAEQETLETQGRVEAFKQWTLADRNSPSPLEGLPLDPNPSKFSSAKAHLKYSLGTAKLWIDWKTPDGKKAKICYTPKDSARYGRERLYVYEMEILTDSNGSQPRTPGSNETISVKL